MAATNSSKILTTHLRNPGKKVLHSSAEGSFSGRKLHRPRDRVSLIQLWKTESMDREAYFPLFGCRIGKRRELSKTSDSSRFMPVLLHKYLQVVKSVG
jgi:hypothetical protein